MRIARRSHVLMPAIRPTDSCWVSASRWTPPLSSTMTESPDARRSIAIVIPAAPAPAMHTSASSVVPSASSAAVNKHATGSFLRWRRQTGLIDALAEGHLASVRHCKTGEAFHPAR